MLPTIDYTALWALAASRFALGPHSLHGPRHWRQVEANALELSKTSAADECVLRCFASLHDSCRQNESHDPLHGQRAADWAMVLRDTVLPLDDARFALLTEAMILHDKGLRSADPTIGTCWDADRLDLVRVGLSPDPAMMSTAPGASLAKTGWPVIR